LSEHQHIAPDGPFKVELTVLAVGEMDGEEVTAEVKFDAPPGAMLTAEWLGKAADNARASIPDGFRLMTRQEFADHIVSERTGIAVRAVISPYPFRIEQFREDR
jgi:hypothetical protein